MRPQTSPPTPAGATRFPRRLPLSLPLLLPLSLAVLLLGSLPAAGAEDGRRWIGPDGPLPFQTHEEIAEFLVEAEVVGQKQLSSGSTKPWRLDLERDGVRARAIFRSIDKTMGRDLRRVEDHFRHEVAAYEIDRLLGLDLVPPAALRMWNRDKGSIQLWIENARSETERIEANISHGDRQYIETLKRRMRVFDALIYNFDRNTGNLLFDRLGRLWLIDHTRSFKVEGDLPDKLKPLLQHCERHLWYAIRDLERKDLKKATRPYLGPLQTAALMERFDALREHFASRIAELGEDEVLYDEP